MVKYNKGRMARSTRRYNGQTGTTVSCRYIRKKAEKRKSRSLGCARDDMLILRREAEAGR